MPSDASKSPEQALKVPDETRTALPADDHVSKALRGFGLVGILAILVILAGNFFFAPLSAILVLVWVRWSRTPWREIGYVRPRGWAGTVAVGIVFGSAFKFLMKAIVMPLLGADPINQAYHYLAGNTAALPAAIYAMILVAGFGEETVFRGYMFERLGKLFGSSVWARTFIVLLTSVLFGLAHYSVQGLAGVEQATNRRAGVRNDLRRHRPDLDADVCARHVRPDCARDDLLESRIQSCSPRLQVGLESRRGSASFNLKVRIHIGCLRAAI